MRPARIWFDGRREALAWRMPSGLPVYVHATFLLTAGVVALPFLIRGGANSYALAFLTPPTLLASIFLHELAHIAVARREGFPPIAISIFGAGGLAEFFVSPERVRLWRVTLAGPAANLGLGLVLLALLWALPEPVLVADPRFSTPPPQPPGLLSEVLFFAGWFNILLGLANLLPAHPLDGGQIVSEWLDPHLGARRVSILVGCFGLVFATLNTILFVLFVLSGFPLWLPPSFAPNWHAIWPGRDASADEGKPAFPADDKVVRFPGDHAPLPGWLRKR